MGQKINILGDSKQRVLNIVKIEALKRFSDLIESSNIEFSGILFNVKDLSTSGKPFVALRQKLLLYWEKFLDWSREEPYLEHFLTLSINASMIYIIFLIVMVAILVMALVQALLKNNQVFATIFASSIAFLGVLLSVAVQGLLAMYKNRVEQQMDGVKKMTEQYEKILKILKRPGYYSLEEVAKFIDEFDDRVEIYGSKNIVHQWKTVKSVFLTMQTNSSNNIRGNCHIFTNFIIAIRRELGHSSSPTTRSSLYRELRAEYETRQG